MRPRESRRFSPPLPSSSFSWDANDDAMSIQSVDVLAIGGPSYNTTSGGNSHQSTTTATISDSGGGSTFLLRRQPKLQQQQPKLHIIGQHPHHQRQHSQFSSDRSVQSDTQVHSHEERQRRRALTLQRAHQRLGTNNGSVNQNNPKISLNSKRPPLTLEHKRNIVHDDDVSSLGGVEDNIDNLDDRASLSLLRLALCLQSNTTPTNMTTAERALWETMQKTLRKQSQIPQQQQSNTDADSVQSTDTWESRYLQVQEQASQQKQESFVSLRALQRVLADVTAERDQALERMQQQQQEASSSRGSSATSSPVQQQQQQDHENTNQELQRRDARILALEKQVQEQKLQLQEQQQQQQQDNSTETMSNNAADDETTASLKKELQDRTSALESAKMIITSLEHASGSLAADMRLKLKSSQDEVSRLKAEAADRQKTLDALAVELRETKRTTPVNSCNSSIRHRETPLEEKMRISEVIARLDRNMSEIRSAAVVFEATQDTAAAEQMSDLFEDSTAALRERIEMITFNEETSGYSGDLESVGGSSVETGSSRGEDRRAIRREFVDGNSANVIRRLEEELKQQKEEHRKLSSTTEKVKKRHKEETEALQSEIQNLRSQYSTNMTVLARKERELAVLRDSLKVDDDVGYISDDATEADEEEEHSPSIPASPPLDISSYGPSQIEALATLLAHGGGLTNASSSPNQTDALKREMLQAKAETENYKKQLSMERESLANAKMIISSLEKANKSMMEDLRSRLQDSNTAIASLLEKSVGNEKTTAQLRINLQTLQREKDQEKLKYRSEIERMRVGVGGPTWPKAIGDEKKETQILMITDTID